MCSTPRAHQSARISRPQASGLSADAMARFTAVANAADERRQKQRAERKKSLNSQKPSLRENAREPSQPSAKGLWKWLQMSIADALKALRV